MKYTDVLGLTFFNGTIVEAVELALRSAQEHKCGYITAPDSELLIAARKDNRIMRALKGAEFCLPEGNGIIYSSDILGNHIQNRISALDFAAALMARMSELGMSFYILGDDSDIVESASINLSARYPGLRLVGTDDGYFNVEQDLIDSINEAKPDLLLVGYGSPKQENWMYRSREVLDVGLMLGFGDELPVAAGAIERAPKRWRDSGFEWFYWLKKDPKKIVRMTKRTRLVFDAVWRRLFG